MPNTTIRLLLIEDDAAEADRIVALLRNAWQDQFEIDVADRLEAALERLRATPIDVVLLDLGLPDSTGVDTFERVHRTPANPPVVVIVNADDELVARRALRSGAQDYLLKGDFDAQRLGRVLRNAVDRKRTDQWIRRLSLAVDQSPASVFITDTRGTIEYINARFTEITGYAPEEVLGRNPRMLQSGRTPPEVYRDLWSTILSGGRWEGEILNRRKDGSLYWDAARISPLRDDAGRVTHFLALQEDITERKNAEAALRASEQRLRTLFETVNLIVRALDATGRVEYVNPYLLKLTGYTREEVIGNDWFELFVSDEDRAHVSGIFREFIDHRSRPHFENTILTKTGERRTISWHNTVLLDAQDRPVGILSIGEDITEHARLETQFLQAQKMEAVGRLAGGVAHDFNNLLTVILGTVDLTLADMRETDPLRADLGEVRAAAERAAGLTRQLLAFSRKQVLEPRVVDLNSLVTNLDRMLRRVIGEDVQLRTLPGLELGAVRADPGQIEQVILNLAINSRDAMPTGGTLTIETANAELDQAYAGGDFVVQPGAYVLLAVSDTGAGMDAATRDHIFEPFFTTKPKGKGTGLGLSTVYGIVKQSGGYIWVYSEPGRGTTFKIYLPRVDAPVQSTAEGRTPLASLAGTETILVVEDEEKVRGVTQKMLEARGYDVLTAESGFEALELAQRYTAPIALLVTDVVMPGMSGRELADRLTQIRPGVQVLYVSGYTDETIVHHGVLAEGVNFLQKPFTPEALARKIRQILDS